MDRLHRVLLRVEATTETEMVVVIPSWNAEQLIKLPKTLLPKGMPVLADDYLLAEVDLDAKFATDLDVQEISENLGPVTEEQVDDFWKKAEANVEQR